MSNTIILNHAIIAIEQDGNIFEPMVCEQLQHDAIQVVGVLGYRLG